MAKKNSPKKKISNLEFSSEEQQNPTEPKEKSVAEFNRELKGLLSIPRDRNKPK